VIPGIVLATITLTGEAGLAEGELLRTVGVEQTFVQRAGDLPVGLHLAHVVSGDNIGFLESYKSS
jgi:hypothetical protein